MALLRELCTLPIEQHAHVLLLYYTEIYCILLYYTSLYFTTLHYTSYTIWSARCPSSSTPRHYYFTILYCTVLHFTILHYTSLYLI